MSQSLHIQPGCVELFAGAGLRAGQALFADPVGEPMDKPGLDRWRVRRRLMLTDRGGGTVTAFLKRYLNPPLRAQLRRVFSRAPWRGTAWWEWEVLGRLASAGIASMTPIAYGQDMLGWWERGSFLLVEAAEGQALERWIPRRWSGLSPRQRRQWVRELGSMIARLHRAGFCHRDLYLSHLFVDAADPEQPKFSLIDLQRVFSPGWRKRRWQIKDLAQLSYSSPAGLVSRHDRWRFLGAYLADATRLEKRRWAKAIERKTQRIARHDARRRARHGISPQSI